MTHYNLTSVCKPVLFILLLLGLTACTGEWKLKQDYQLHILPPGGVKAAENFFCDEQEVLNVNWREYRYWTKRIFGPTSREYLSTMPDTGVWVQKDPCLISLNAHYYNYPPCDYYPLVGISQQQAIDFSNWRSDRVFERMLILNKIIPEDDKQTRETYFSIDRYFEGKYQHIKPDTNYRYYPQYRLPTIEEYKSLVKYAQAKGKRFTSQVQAGIVPCANDTFTMVPTTNRYSAKPYLAVPFNLKGNVSEWASEKDISLGGSWADSKERIAQQDTFHVNQPNAWTGFRNVCEWKKYTGQ